MGHTIFGSQGVSLDPSAFLHSGKGSSVAGLVPPNHTVNSVSVVSIKPGDSSMVIGYQVDEFTHTWLVEC